MEPDEYESIMRNRLPRNLLRLGLYYSGVSRVGLEGGFQKSQI